MLSWCHGAPGIALARLCLIGTPLFDATAERDLRRALETTAASRLPEDSLCCGRFGQAAILRLAAGALGDGGWLGVAKEIEARALGSRQARGAFSFRDLLGLFTGAAGVRARLLDGASGERTRALPAALSAGLIDRPPKG